MSSVLPLEVLGLMGPILCWVEGGRNPGLPESWHSTDFSLKDRVQHWLMNELPTYSYDSLDEVISLAGDRRVDFIFPMEPSRSRAKELESVKIPPKGFDLVCVFSQLSRRYFQWAGNELCIREDRMVELHELAMRFPVRHLIQYCHADAVARGYICLERAFELPFQMSQLHTTYRSLRTVVDKGLSEGHLHLNGVINADEAWCDQLLRRFSPGVGKTFSAERNRLLVLSRTVIQLLAVGLIYAVFDEDEISLPSNLIVLLDKLYRAKTLVRSYSISKDLSTLFLEELKKLRTKINNRFSLEKIKELEWLMPLIYSDMNFKLIRGVHPRQKNDIFEEIGVRLRMRLLKKLHLSVNRVLIERNVRSVTATSDGEPYEPEWGERTPKIKSSPVREFLHQLAYRYIIYHTHHWQEATQSGQTTGLRKFQSYFDSPQREILSGNTADTQGLAVERLSMAKPLRAVEGRLGPPTTGAAKYLPWILAFAQQVKSDNLDKFGLVVHFKKNNYKKKTWKTNTKDIPSLRYGKIRRLTRLDAVKLFRLLSTPHPVVPFIMGIDAANLELTTPPEVFAPAFRFLRHYPIKLRRRSSTKERFGKYDDIAALVEGRRLGMTYHVGEDFRHLLSGLRAIHEVIEYLKPLPGDRLGHAIALALKPEIWAAQVGYQAVMPRQEWLDTLVWLHYLLGPGHDLIGQLAIEDQIQLHSRRIYGKEFSDNCRQGREGWMPITLYDSWRLRQLDPYSVVFNQKQVNRKFGIRQLGRGEEDRRWADIQTIVLNETDRHIGTDAAYDLVRSYWYNPDVLDRGSRIITIEMQENKKLWLEVFREAQKRMQDMVRDKQLVVEVNPSSNRIIGPMESMADHPIFQLTLDKEHQMEKQIRVTINTDDPGVFATSLSHEFYLMGESLLARDVPEPEVVEWLEWLRKNGTEYSFLHGLSGAENKHMKSILNYLLKKNEPLLNRLEGKRRKYEPTLEDKFVQLKDRVEELDKEEEIKQLKNRIEKLEKNLAETN
jgi:hypothetical protein